MNLFSPARLLPFCSTAIFLTLVTSAATADNSPPPEGFRAIFNGQNLTGWHGNDPHQTSKAAADKRDEGAQQGELFRDTVEKMHASVDRIAELAD